MVTELEIIDTAIKIGLGALISGCTGYFMTERSHTHEMRKSMANEKKELLKEITINLEQSSSLANECIFSINQLNMRTVTNKEEEFLHLLKQFLPAFNKAKDARALCYLIEEKSLGEFIARYTVILDEVYKHYAEHKLQYDWNFVDSNGDKRTEVRNEMLDRLGKVFGSIYT